MPESPEKRQLSLDAASAGQRHPDSSEVLDGLVESIVFRNESNGYTVISLAGRDDTVAVGTLPYLSAGESIRLYGRWVTHPDYGEQFQVDHYELSMPKSRDSILQYLKSGLIKGIGPKTARLLVNEFGVDTLDILREQPDRVAQIKGIGLKKAQKIADELAEKLDYQELSLFLTPLGLTAGKILKIYRQFGQQAKQLVSENPYRLADEIDGIGFATADKLAQSMGLDPTSPQRIASALKYLLYQSVQQGHTYLPVAVLLQLAGELLDLTVGMDHEALSILKADSKIRFFLDTNNQKEARVALAGLFFAEDKAASRLAVLLGSRPKRFDDFIDAARAEKAIDRSCTRQHLQLAQSQKDALVKTLQNPVSILTGGPGTGKTTIVKLLCDCIEDLGGKILLAAPTGRAAMRMTEACGIKAKTLHRLLEIQFQPDSGRSEYASGYKSDVQLACDLLIVDEMSMVDASIFCSLIEAVIPGTRLVMVGDADQLPSVGPGYVLKDLIDSNTIPIARLTEVFRQSSQSLIIRNAHRIHDGQMPEMDQTLNSQFLWVVKDSAVQIAEAVEKLCKDILPNQYGLDGKSDVQVLASSRKGPSGTRTLNQVLQHDLNTDQPAVEAHGIRFMPGDKVMQIKNNYDMAWHLQADRSSTGSGVFNGETGLVRSVDPDEQIVEVLYDDSRIVQYDRMTLEDLDLAYAMTIHKSQGSEYPVVVLALPAGAPQLLTRNLLYTAVTRAKSKLILVAAKWTVSAMLKNDKAYKRYTMLAERLRSFGLDQPD